MFDEFEHVRIKSRNLPGTILDKYNVNGVDWYTVESGIPGPVEGGYGDLWPLFNCMEEDLERRAPETVTETRFDAGEHVRVLGSGVTGVIINHGVTDGAAWYLVEGDVSCLDSEGFQPLLPCTDADLERIPEAKAS